MTSDELLVLRFRDLALSPGETIVRHRREIATHDRCWWGWWSRNHELSPRDRILTLALPREVALFDTDQMRVYSATCVDIRAKDAEFLSPKVDQTPSYYNRKRLRAWFCFTEIDDTDPAFLLGRKCVYTTAPDDVPDDFEVTNLQDLRQSFTTMWILSGRD